MPELPEVETIKNELSPKILGKQITKVIIYDEKPIRGMSAHEFSKNLAGQKIENIERRGKYFIFHLSKTRLIVHLRMTGVLTLDSEQDKRFIRVVFKLKDGSSLVFSDRRRLGVMWLSKDAGEVLNKLGPEPLNREFTAEVLAQRLNGRKAPIKAALLDQKVIAGIGNMYADEALFEARIHPLKPAGKLSKTQLGRLHAAIRNVLNRAIERKGASIDTYKRPDGSTGSAHDEFRVAHRKDEVCPECGGMVERIMIRNRGSYFCPACQKLK